MKVIINGQEEEISREELSVSDLLSLKRVEMPEMVSVELNGEFLNRAEFGATRVKAGDQIEFIYFMGGGASHEI